MHITYRAPRAYSQARFDKPALRNPKLLYNPQQFKLQLPKLPSLYQSQNQPLVSPKQPSEPSQHLTVTYVCSMQEFRKPRSQPGIKPSGNQKTNQDANFEFQSKYFSIFCVCDGHGAEGHFVSHYVATHLGKLLKRKLLGVHRYEQGEKLAQAISQLFRVFDHELMENKSFKLNLSGTTSNIVLILDDFFCCPNVGDSRAVFFYKTVLDKVVKDDGECYDFWSNKALSTDHKPSRLTEYNRIIACNGRIQKKQYCGKRQGPLRVWLPFEDVPGLAMSRSFGDSIAKLVGVNAEPEIVLYKPQKPGYIIVASDGFWDQIENSDIYKILNQKYPPLSQEDADSTMQQLLNFVNNNWDKCSEGRDDITIQLIYVTV